MKARTFVTRLQTVCCLFMHACVACASRTSQSGDHTAACKHGTFTAGLAVLCRRYYAGGFYINNVQVPGSVITQVSAIAVQCMTSLCRLRAVCKKLFFLP